ncbi:tetratricopeptide repeat protein [Polynucleobacter sp. AP-Feld-500C-C5]|uniref:tetratricopeptide repeat protein n=1 Tax=Polynucleobacter sp. AP-Feld-500C-C5 TaxID=2576924 RepID=UPI001C0B55FE|nr:sel1 repeat family protein [Polynucleobacter sp. AP-Feld-500C-C5]MBU3631835.1 sel1 repeat family protein [Polynucleobacter sp. AP-Feld-500C-C5]
MASREFLKILQSARIGDVSAQQRVASAYLTGAFKTPIQPANALIWLEKSYLSIQNQVFSQLNPSHGEILELDGSAPEILKILEQILEVPLEETINSPAFSFGWKLFWKLANSNLSASYAAQWQLAELLLNPNKRGSQSELAIWLSKKNDGDDFLSLQKKAKEFLLNLADSETPFTKSAKALLITLQPKNEGITYLWNSWVLERNEGALIEAAELGLTIAKLTLGLRLAQLDKDLDSKTTSSGKPGNKSNASLKKAAYWLGLAANDGDRDAWFALGEIYRRPQFSGYNATESNRCFDRAADLGHAQAQFRRGANLWRKREKIDDGVRGLQASYWIWQAHQQGAPGAKELLGKILENVADPKMNSWFKLATFAESALNHHQEQKLVQEWALLCHRVILANQFNLSKAEMLLCDVNQLQREHCVVVDIRYELPKILPRLIQIDTTQQRRSLLAAGKIFADIKLDQEGNLRQRRYRFDRVAFWLENTFSKNAYYQTDSEVV